MGEEKKREMYPHRTNAFAASHRGKSVCVGGEKITGMAAWKKAWRGEELTGDRRSGRKVGVIYLVIR